MYKCECYIRNGELKNHRIINAAAREQILLNRICDWYMTAKLNHDLQLCNYLKRMALHEYKSCNFPQISAYNKFKFLLAFYCSPLYYAYAMASTLIAAILHYCDIYWSNTMNFYRDCFLLPNLIRSSINVSAINKKLI